MKAKDINKGYQELEKKIGKLERELKVLDNMIPGGHIRFYMSNKEQREEIYFTGRKTTLTKWIKETIKERKIKL